MRISVNYIRVAEEPLDGKAMIVHKVKGLLETFADRHPPLTIKLSSLNKLLQDPERFLHDLNVDKVARFFCNEPEGFDDDLYVGLFKDFQEIRANLPTSAISSNDEVQSFGCDYKDPRGGVSSFASYLMECSNAFHNDADNFLSPYISLVQSSMYGKTRLLREIARSHYRTVYVCLREKDSTGYPPRTEGAFSFLFSEHKIVLTSADESKFSAILANRFKHLIVAALRNLHNPVLLGAAPDVMNVRNKAAFPSELIESMLFNDTLHQPWIGADGFPKMDECPGPSPHLVLLAIDEARYTLEKRSFASGKSLFRHIRQAARLCAIDLPSYIRFMVVFVDTSSRIQNFSPSLSRDPSYRLTDLQDENMNRILFRPYILSDTFDVHFNRVLARGSTDLRALCDSVEWLNAGRPTMKDHSSISDSTLVFKLQGGQGAPTLLVDKLAIVLARIGAQIYPGKHYAAEMVADNMATLLDASLDRESCLTAFVSEPALARAAGRIWHNDLIMVADIIPALHEAVMSGAFNKGRDGELVAQIIILLAFDKVCTSLVKGIGEVVPLRLVITELLPDELDEAAVDDVLDKCIPVALKDSVLSCVQFVNLCGPLQHDDILHLAERHNGGVLSAGQPGLDLYLPILHSELAAVVIQVKACATLTDSNYPRSAGVKLRPSVAFKDSPLAGEIDLKTLDTNAVRIYMQVGVIKPSVKYRCNEVKKDLVAGGALPSFPLQIFGVSSRCLSPSLRASLSGLLQDNIDWETFIRRESYLETHTTPARTAGPNPRSLDKKRSSWPFVIRPVP